MAFAKAKPLSGFLFSSCYFLETDLSEQPFGKAANRCSREAEKCLSEMLFQSGDDTSDERLLLQLAK